MIFLCAPGKTFQVCDAFFRDFHHTTEVRMLQYVVFTERFMRPRLLVVFIVYCCTIIVTGKYTVSPARWYIKKVFAPLKHSEQSVETRIHYRVIGYGTNTLRQKFKRNSNPIAEIVGV